MVLALVIEDDVDFLGAVATDIRAWVKLIYLLNVTDPVVMLNYVMSVKITHYNECNYLPNMM